MSCKKSLRKGQLQKALTKVVIAPDSFKGSLTAMQVADTIAEVVHELHPHCEVVKLPLADGGEGSIDAILSALNTASNVAEGKGDGGNNNDADNDSSDSRRSDSTSSVHSVQVLSPDEQLIDAQFGIIHKDKGKSAVLEVAQSSGITRQAGLNPMTSSTYGFGQLILAALDVGVRDFTLCIGGSASTDGGCGMAAALGVKFLDADGKYFVPNGEMLSQIESIDVSMLDSRIAQSKFTVLCDVSNPLFGLDGAAHIYAPQKGATPTQVKLLDVGLRHLSKVVTATTDRNYADFPGAGAAGGLGFGSMVFLQAELVSGIKAILDLCQFEEHLQEADLIITGEGKLDSQSFSGKALSGILQAAEEIPVISICGSNDCDEISLSEQGIKVYVISEYFTLEESMQNPESCLKMTTSKALSQLSYQTQLP